MTIEIGMLLRLAANVQQLWCSASRAFTGYLLNLEECENGLLENSKKLLSRERV